MSADAEYRILSLYNNLTIKQAIYKLEVMKLYIAQKTLNKRRLYNGYRR